MTFFVIFLKRVYVIMKNCETQNRVYSVEEAGARLGLGRNSSYQAVRSGDIPSFKIGGRYFRPKKLFDRMLDGEDSVVNPVE